MMLNLLYYDFVAILKKLWYYILIIVALAFAVRFIWSDTFITSFFDNDNLYVGYVCKYVAAGFLGAFGGLIVIIAIVDQAQWFDENILSAQGQLTNMYPASSLQIVFSKIINSLLWAIIMVAVALGVFSIFCVGSENFKNIMETIADVATSNNIHISIGGITASLFLCLVTAIVSILSLSYLSQTIGQMFNNMRNLIVLISFVLILALVFFILYALAQNSGIFQMFQEAVANKDQDTILKFFTTVATRCAITNVITCLLYCFATAGILRSRLNLL